MNKWISVKDSLPTPLLITNGTRSTTILFSYKFFRVQCGQFYFRRSGRIDFKGHVTNVDDIATITTEMWWMHLPQEPSFYD